MLTYERNILGENERNDDELLIKLWLNVIRGDRISEQIFFLRGMMQWSLF